MTSVVLIDVLATLGFVGTTRYVKLRVSSTLGLVVPIFGLLFDIVSNLC